jgi:hypothetical protein
MLIMQVYHDSSHMPDSDQKMRLRSYARLWSYAQLRSEDMTPVVYLDSGRTFRFLLTSWLQSYLLTLVVHQDYGRWAWCMSYHHSCERLCMARLDNCSILQPGHLVRSRLVGTHDSFIIQNLSISQLCMFKCQVMGRATDRHLARFDLRETWVSRRTRYPCNSGGLRSSNV